jgi:ParB-like chromosome segregation protein Spo0J
MALKLTGVTTHGKKDELGFNPLELVPNFSAFTGRKERTEDAIQKMIASFLLHGQEQAFLYRKGFAGNPIPVTGHTRILAAARITSEGMTDAKGNTYSPDNPFVVYGTYRQMNELEAVIHTFVENDPDSRTPINDVDIAFLIRTLSENYGITDADIASKLGKPASFVSNHRKVLDLDPETQAALAAGTIKFDAAINTVLKIEPAKRKAAIASAQAASPNGRASASAIAKAASDLGATVAAPLKRTDADVKRWIDKTIEATPVGAAQAFLFAVKDFRAGIISEIELDAKFAALSEVEA